MKQKILFIFYLMLFFILNVYSQEIKDKSTVILKDGREYKGNLIKIDEQDVIFEIDGKINNFKKIDVSKINLAQKRLYEDKENISQIADPEIKWVWEDSKKWEINQNQNIIILLDKLTYNFNENNQLVIRIKKGIKILNEDGKELSKQYFYYLKNYYSAKLLYGITIMNDGAISYVDEEAINDEPINGNFPQYDNLQRIKFGLKNIDVGSVFVWEAEVKGSFSDLENPFFTQRNLISEFPIEKRIVQFITPENVNLNFYYKDGILPYKESQIRQFKLGTKKFYIMEENNIGEFINDELQSPASDLIYPFFYATVNTNWQTISTNYFNKFFKVSPSNSIKKFAMSIVKDETNDLKKINLLYEYVNRSIKLVDIEMSNSKYIPSEDDKILKSNNLNVLDKSYLFIRLLNSIGIDGKMFFYRNNGAGKLIDEVASLKQFDSTICMVEIDGKKTLVSFENENFALGQTNFNASEASCLQVTKPYSTKEVLPKINPDDNKTEVIYECELTADNTLIVKSTMTIYGKLQAEYRTKRFLSKEELDKWAKEGASRFGNDYTLESYNFVNNLSDFDKPVIYEEKIKVTNYSFSYKRGLKLFKLPAFFYNSKSVSKQKRIFPFDFYNTNVDNYKFSIKLPETYQVIFTPQPINYTYDDFSFTGEYKIEDGKILFEAKNVVSKRIIPQDKYETLKLWMEEKTKFSSEWIMIGEK